MVVLVAVALTAVPLAHERRPHVPAVDAVVHELQQQRPAHDRGRLLVAAVGDAELVRVEVRHGAADRGDRVVRAASIAYDSSTSCAISASSGNSKPLPQSSGSHGSSGSTADADSHVDISGVCVSVPKLFSMWPSVSPLVV